MQPGKLYEHTAEHILLSELTVITVEKEEGFNLVLFIADLPHFRTCPASGIVVTDEVD
jgi:hypothetical protein